MATIRVEFEVPDDIAKGLSNGTFERVGGVIRHADSKQVFAWLREGGNMSRNSSSTLKLLPSLLQIAGMNAKTVAVVAGAVTIAGPLLDVAITAYAIHHLTARIRALKKEIADIYDRLDKYLTQSAEVTLNAALKFAEAFVEQEDYETKKAMLPTILLQLAMAEQWLLAELKKAVDRNQMRRALDLCAAVFTVDMMEAQCHREIGDEAAALRSLNKNVKELKPYVEMVVQKLIGKRAALYAHPSVKNQYLDRYVSIRRWLYDESDVWMAFIKEARKDILDEKAFKRLYRRRQKFLHVWHELRKKPFYMKAIPRAELLIESFQRLKAMPWIWSLPIDQLETWRCYPKKRHSDLPTTTTMCLSLTKIHLQGWRG